MERSIDYPCTVVKSNTNNGTYVVKLPDVSGVVAKDSVESKSIDEAADVAETVLSKHGNYPTPSDLSYIARENPKADVRLLSLDLDEITRRRKESD